MMIRRFIFTLSVLFFLLSIWVYGGEAGSNTKVAKKKTKLSSTFYMREQKLLTKNLQPVYKKLFYNPKATCRKKHLSIIYGRAVGSNLDATSDYSEEYNGYRYYKKVLPATFLDERPRDQELFGIVERLIARKLLSYEKDGKFHPLKKLSRGEVFYHFIKLLNLTDIEGGKIPSIYQAANQLNEHLSRISDVSGSKNKIPGFIKMAEYYKLLPPFDSKVYGKEKDFFISFGDGKDFYLHGKNGPLFGVNYPATLGFLTYLVADNLVKWDIAAYLPEGSEVGNISKSYENKTLKANSLVDAYITGFDPHTGILQVKAKHIGEEAEKEYTFYLPEDAYIWVVDKGRAYQLNNKKRREVFHKILVKFNTPRMYRFSVNALFKIIPMKLKNNIQEKEIALPDGQKVKIPVIGYLELILNRFDYEGIIEGVSDKLISVRLPNGKVRNFIKDKDTQVKVRIYGPDAKYLKTIYDQLLKPENFNYWRKGVKISFKVDASGKMEYVRVPLLKIGKVRAVDLGKLSLATDTMLNGVYFLAAPFSEVPLYIVSSKKRNFSQTTDFSSLLNMDGSVLPLQLYVQPASVKSYPLNYKKKIPQLGKISFGIGIE